MARSTKTTYWLYAADTSAIFYQLNTINWKDSLFSLLKVAVFVCDGEMRRGVQPKSKKYRI